MVSAAADMVMQETWWRRSWDFCLRIGRVVRCGVFNSLWSLDCLGFVPSVSFRNVGGQWLGPTPDAQSAWGEIVFRVVKRGHKFSRNV